MPDVSSAPLPLPPVAERHYRAFAWVVHEQRLMALLLGTLAAATGMVWLTGAGLQNKPPVIVHAPPSLRDAADRGGAGIGLGYDSLAFFLNGCVPLLYQAESGRHPWLSLAEGLVAPEICREAERRLQSHAAEMAAKGVSQSLVISAIDQVVSDPASARVAARVSGVVRILAPAQPPRDFPWQAHAVLTANLSGRLNPYPYFLLSLETEAAP